WNSDWKPILRSDLPLIAHAVQRQGHQYAVRHDLDEHFHAIVFDTAGACNPKRTDLPELVKPSQKLFAEQFRIPWRLLGLSSQATHGLFDVTGRNRGEKTLHSGFRSGEAGEDPPLARHGAFHVRQPARGEFARL